MAIDALLDDLRNDPDFMRNVSEWQRAPILDGRYGEFPAALDARVVAAFGARGIQTPYTHQAQAIAAALRGEHVAVAASAAGGKSMCFQAPIAHTLVSHPNARALLLFPTKALSQDQLNALAALLEQVEAGLGKTVAAYDGDTPQAKRADIRRAARAVVSNADMLHMGILPHHTRWAAFLKQLRYVVIDELHSYRGIFGSHVANVIRRLKRLCAFYGSHPVFIMASATIANPQEHAERLIEAPVTLVDDDGSPRGERHVILVNPPLLDAEMGVRQSADFLARDIAARFITGGAQTICFARSRQSTEVLLTYLRQRLTASSDAPPADLAAPKPVKANAKNKGGFAKNTIVGYRGGYLPEERRAIEAGLRAGTVRGVVSTNALELGIDIGELDCSVLLGYPGSIASFWQQAGRSGRRGQAAAAVMVTNANALDQYLSAHPDYLFSQSPESARIAPDNLGVLAAHVACATFELPFGRGERLGNAYIDELLEALAEDGDVHRSGIEGLPLFSQDEPGGHKKTTDEPRQAPSDVRYTWVGDGYPAERVSLRGAGDRVVIQFGDTLIGETERGSAPARVHPGAIYLHQGETFRIVELDWENGRAEAIPVQSEYYTIAASSSQVAVLEEFSVAGREASGTHIGEIEVVTRAGRYRQIQFSTHQTLGFGDIDLPAQHLLTVGYWFSIPEEIAKTLERAGIIAMPNDYGPNWQQQRNAARTRDGFKCTVCGKPETPERQHDVHHKKPFRTFGYRRDENERYLEANQLSNLVTVCPDCHARIETAQMVNHPLNSLCYLIANLAPLYVMCDPSDISAVFDVESTHTRLPTVTIYEMTPGGTGLSEELMHHHVELLDMAAARIRECACEHGCPACVGPIAAEEVGSRDIKRDTQTLIAALRGKTV